MYLAIIVIPEPLIGGIIETTGDDNKLCGGQAGDGWKSYGTCMSKACVAEKSAEAAAAMSASLVEGKCLDIRVKRNALNARVCGRVINC